MLFSVICPLELAFTFLRFLSLSLARVISPRQARRATTTPPAMTRNTPAILGMSSSLVLEVDDSWKALHFPAPHHL